MDYQQLNMLTEDVNGGENGKQINNENKNKAR